MDFTIREAAYIAEQISELDHHTHLASADARIALIALHHLLATHTNCPTCTTHRHDAARLHHILGQHT